MQSMQMSDNEIIKSYLEAKNHDEQIAILADLNLCSKEKIKYILIKGGALLPTEAKDNAATEAEEDAVPGSKGDAVPGGKKDTVPGGNEDAKPEQQGANFKYDYELVRQLYNQGMGDAEIASTIGVKSKSSIIRWRKKNNLPPQSQRGENADGKTVAAETNTQMVKANKAPGTQKPKANKEPVKKVKEKWQSRFETVLSTVMPHDTLLVRMAYRDLLVRLAPYEFEKALYIDELIKENSYTG